MAFRLQLANTNSHSIAIPNVHCYITAKANYWPLWKNTFYLSAERTDVLPFSETDLPLFLCALFFAVSTWDFLVQG